MKFWADIMSFKFTFISECTAIGKSKDETFKIISVFMKTYLRDMRYHEFSYRLTTFYTLPRKY